MRKATKEPVGLCPEERLIAITGIESTRWGQVCASLPVLLCKWKKCNFRQQKQLSKITQLVGVRGGIQTQAVWLLSSFTHSWKQQFWTPVMCLSPSQALGGKRGVWWRTDYRLRVHVLHHYTHRIPMRWVWTLIIIIFNYLYNWNYSIDGSCYKMAFVCF